MNPCERCQQRSGAIVVDANGRDFHQTKAECIVALRMALEASGKHPKAVDRKELVQWVHEKACMNGSLETAGEIVDRIMEAM